MDSILFPALMLGLAVAAPMGPMALLCVQRTLARGQVQGLITGLGIATADATLAAIASFGLTAVTAALVGAAGWIRPLGAMVLIYLGMKIARAPAAATTGTGAQESGGRALLLAYGLTMTNPLTILFFAGAFATIPAAASPLGAVRFSLGVLLGSMLWWLLLTTVTALGARFLTDASMRWINRISGTALILFACYGLVMALGNTR